jgi:methylenetetrahydrofolate dehydrogenase (NADP+)/methenyltetrahydrofolate cyclohydrolase
VAATGHLDGARPRHLLHVRLQAQRAAQSRQVRTFAIPRVLDGAACAAAIRAELTPGVAAFTAAHGRPPALHIVLVGDDPASHVYVRGKERTGAAAGLSVTVHRLDAATPLDDLLTLVARLNADDGCDGILVQAPLPAAMGKHASQRVFDAIDPAKDVDGFHPHNVGLLVQGRATLKPCTPSGVIELLTREHIEIAGRRAVVIGRSEIVGKPMALLLLQRDATVTICHSRTADLTAVAREADILVAAIGRPGFVTADYIKPGAVVVDVGVNRVVNRAEAVAMFGEGSARLATFDEKKTGIVGDVHPLGLGAASAFTPVPGGVGPLTIVMLLKNTLAAAVARR